ncbi:MAG: hypothetical protein HYT98_02125 [Candidatus Sungbacteria bacterium]|nr:hypothetical protein [Candidatus Sungbacteria bacterium]
MRRSKVKVETKKVKHEWGKNRMVVLEAGENLDLGKLFEKDTLVSHEYWDSLKRKMQLDPEKQLLFAVLEDAVHCFQKYISFSSRRGRTLFLDADTWIQEKDANDLFSFEGVCDHLGFDADYVREGLNRWKERNRCPVEIQVSRKRRGRKLRDLTVFEVYEKPPNAAVV